MTRPWREWRYNHLSKAKYKKRWRRRPIREISTQRLASPIWPPNWRMTGERMSGNSLRPLACRPEGFTPLSWERRWWVREITRRRTSLRRSGGNESAAWSAWRLLAATLTKAKNTKCRNYNVFFYSDFPEIIGTHSVYMYRYLWKSIYL